jgi:hypothetical protein
MTANIIELELTPVLARKYLREIATDSGKVFFSDHVLKRMAQRKITTVQVMRCLKVGEIDEGPTRSIDKGNWEMLVSVISAGDILKVALALDTDSNGNYIIVITAYYA